MGYLSTCSWVAALLVRADEEDVRILKEGVVRAIAMVHIKIENHHLQPTQMPFLILGTADHISTNCIFPWDSAACSPCTAKWHPSDREVIIPAARFWGGKQVGSCSASVQCNGFTMEMDFIILSMQEDR